MKYFVDNIDKWYQEWPGKLVAELEQEQLRNLLSHFSGDYLVQIGGLSDLSLVQSSPIRNKIYIGSHLRESSKNTSQNNLYIEANLDELPLHPESIDTIVLFHTLEYLTHPKAMLEELHHFIAPNGQLIILGLNPMSLWGLKNGFRKEQHFPWGARFLPESEIKHWLRTIGYRVVVSKTFCFWPPLKNPKTLNKLLFMDAIGQICLPWLGGFYMIMAQKRVAKLTPLREDWWTEEVLLNHNGHAKPTTRNVSHESW